MGRIFTKTRALFAFTIIVVLCLACIPFFKKEKGNGKFRFPCRRYLDIRKMEENGIGCYAYILFTGQPASKADSAVYLHLQELWQELPESTVLQNQLNTPPEALSIIYWPIINPGDPKTIRTYEKKNPSWKFSLDSYDYAFAKLISCRLDIATDQGPYFIASRHPLLRFALEDSRIEITDSVWMCSINSRTPSEADSLFSVFQHILSGDIPTTPKKSWDNLLEHIRDQLAFINGELKPIFNKK